YFSCCWPVTFISLKQHRTRGSPKNCDGLSDLVRKNTIKIIAMQQQQQNELSHNTATSSSQTINDPTSNIATNQSSSNTNNSNNTIASSSAEPTVVDLDAGAPDVEDDDDDDNEKIIEKSPSERFQKRNIRQPVTIVGVDSTYLSIDPKVGREVLWNEVLIGSDQGKAVAELESLFRKLRRINHPSMVRILDNWTVQLEDGQSKFVFVTERTEEGSLKQYLSNSKINSVMWRKYTGILLSVIKFLSDAGIVHGNLSSESIHYHTSGTLKVGCFAISQCLGSSRQRLTDYSRVPQSVAYLAPECRQSVAASAENVADSATAEAATPPSGPMVRVNLASDIYAHRALLEVPSLVILCGTALVSFIPAERRGDNSRLQELVDHFNDKFDNDTVICKMTKDGIERTRYVKEMTHSLSMTVRFLEDIRYAFETYRIVS
uniref:Protein kinase domain-containing protein n=1 Tax=Macrostomum lignano TaxID=282301 RepID=A0A1I8HIA1_9PLAT